MAAHGALRASLRRVGALGTGACVCDFLGRRYFEESFADSVDQLRAQRALIAGAGGRSAEGEALGQLAQMLNAERQWIGDGAAGGESGLSASVRAACGHAVRCGPSRVLGGGDGVFAVGAIPAGRVVSAYAGDWLCAWDSLFDRIARLLMPRSRNGEYLLCQGDGSTADGAAQTAACQRSRYSFVRPSACGQLVNHPPAGSLPNLVQMHLRLPRCDCDDLLISVPKAWPGCGVGFGTPRSQPADLLVTVFVSITPIADGEEVFHDYGFGDDAANLPEWYVPVIDGARSTKVRGPSMADYLDHQEHFR